jgi:hypothetical protein
MEEQLGKYVRNLRAWSLPRVEELEDKLVDELAAKARVMYFDRGLFAEEFYPVFVNRLREVAGAISNTVIDYWAKGYADGNDGQYPELCVEFPYLQQNEDVEPLTVTYRVDNQDQTHTELSRVTLDAVLMELIENDPPTRVKRRVKVTAAKLRELADKIESVDPRSAAE